jgi:hypothetical protein
LENIEYEVISDVVEPVIEVLNDLIVVLLEVLVLWVALAHLVSQVLAHDVNQYVVKDKLITIFLLNTTR